MKALEERNKKLLKKIKHLTKKSTKSKELFLNILDNPYVQPPPPILRRNPNLNAPKSNKNSKISFTGDKSYSRMPAQAYKMRRKGNSTNQGVELRLALARANGQSSSSSLVKDVLLKRSGMVSEEGRKLGVHQKLLRSGNNLFENVMQRSQGVINHQRNKSKEILEKINQSNARKIVGNHDPSLFQKAATNDNTGAGRRISYTEAQLTTDYQTLVTLQSNHSGLKEKNNNNKDIISSPAKEQLFRLTNKSALTNQSYKEKLIKKHKKSRSGGRNVSKNGSSYKASNLISKNVKLKPVRLKTPRRAQGNKASRKATLGYQRLSQTHLLKSETEPDLEPRGHHNTNNNQISNSNSRKPTQRSHQQSTLPSELHHPGKATLQKIIENSLKKTKGSPKNSGMTQLAPIRALKKLRTDRNPRSSLKGKDRLLRPDKGIYGKMHKSHNNLKVNRSHTKKKAMKKEAKTFKIKWFGTQKDFYKLEFFVNLGELIGRGTFGEVYSAILRSSGQRVALKIFSKNQNSYKDKKMMNSEIEVLRAMSHPGIVKLVTAFETVNKVCLAMEFLGETNFHQNLEKREEKFLKEAKNTLHPTKSTQEPTVATSQSSSLPGNRLGLDIKRLIFLLLDSLEHMHLKGYSHRDLKLSNIMLRNGRRPVLIDFGMALKVGDMKDYLVCGTECYMAPEMLTYEGYDSTKVDIWCLGIIMFRLMTGFYPFGENAEEGLKENIKKGLIKFEGCGLGRGEESVVRLMLAKDPQRRPTASMLKLHSYWDELEGLEQDQLWETELSEPVSRIEIEEGAEKDFGSINPTPRFLPKGMNNTIIEQEQEYKTTHNSDSED